MALEPVMRVPSSYPIFLLLLLFLHILPLAPLSASVLLKNPFDDASQLKDWVPYTNDENKENGWVVQNSVLFQRAGNSDNAPGGERFIIRPNVFDVTNLQFPIEIVFDLFPYGYVGNNEVWFGAAVFANPDEPDKNEIIVALRRDEANKVNGLNIAVGGKAWICSDNNITTPTLFFHWHRVRIKLDRESRTECLSLLAKTWTEGTVEPTTWTLKTSLPLKEFPICGSGFALGVNALYGFENSNPCAYFDNLIVVDSGENSNVCPAKVKGDGDLLRQQKIDDLQRLYEAGKYKKYAFSLTRLLEHCPDVPETPDLLFNLMLSLRKSSEWEKARKVANRIAVKYPQSKYGMMMGGAEGRTEDEAAVKFASAITQYYKKDYSGCISTIKEFQKQFPNNWRKKDALYYLCLAHYNLKDYVALFKTTDIFLSEFGRTPEAEEAMILLIASHTQKAEQEKARSLINEFRRRFAQSPHLDEIDQMEIETYFFKANFNITLSDWRKPEKQQLFDRLEKELIDSIDRWYRKDKLHWLEKNLDFLMNFYERTDRRNKAIDKMREIFARTSTGEKAHRIVFENAYRYFLDKGILEEAENLTRDMLSWEKNEKEKRVLRNLLAVVLKKQGRDDEATQILRRSE